MESLGHWSPQNEPPNIGYNDASQLIAHLVVKEGKIRKSILQRLAMDFGGDVKKIAKEPSTYKL